MSIVEFNATTETLPLKIVVPHHPEFAANELHRLHGNISDIKQSASTAAEDSSIDEKRYRSADAAQLIESNIDELQGHLEHLESYVNDMEEYATFWRQLALKYIRESRRNIRVVYVPFCDIGRR